MQVIVESDHGGFELKEQVVAFVRELGHEVIDVETDNTIPPPTALAFRDHGKLGGSQA